MKIDIKVEMSSNLQLSEVELRALDALAGYGTDAFLKCFYEHMGSAYLKPHEAGLRSLFENISKNVKPALYEIGKAKESLKAVGIVQ